MAGYTWVAKHQSTGWVSTYKSDYPWTPAQMGPACRSMPYTPPHVNSRPLATPYVRISNIVPARYHNPLLIKSPTFWSPLARTIQLCILIALAKS